MKVDYPTVDAANNTTPIIDDTVWSKAEYADIEQFKKYVDYKVFKEISGRALLASFRDILAN